MKLNKVFLIIGQLLLGFQWLKMTLGLAGLIIIGQKEMVLPLLNTYYLVMIGFLICSGFLYAKDKLTNKEVKG